MTEWSNWSGSVKFTPHQIVEPTTEEEIVNLILHARETGKRIRPVGSSHSSSSIFETNEILVSLKHFNQFITHDNTSCTAQVGAAMTIEKAGETLFDLGLSLHNQGDINQQTLIGGSFAGTHGTGAKLKIIADCLQGVRLINGKGEMIEFTEAQTPDMMKAIRVSLGTLGIVTEVKLKLEPAFTLRRQEWCTGIFECMDHLNELIGNNRNFDFYWYPRSDQVKLRTWNIPGKEPGNPSYADLVKNEIGPAYLLLSRERHLKFEEMEYGIPFEAGPECFWEVRKAVKTFRHAVGWRVLYRTIAEDANYLSIANRRKIATISLHQNHTLPYEEYFKAIEPIFLAYGGRPHWGKKHYLQAPMLKKLYPDWQYFQTIRAQLDPDGIFITPYMQQLLIGD